MLAPIILFTYNRPHHTEHTLNALMQNKLANESVLYIFCDGPKTDASDEQIKKISEVRQIIRKRQWCREIHIKESERNKGLANSIIDGVTEVIEKHGKVIVLEDDLITSPWFLKYMNEALNFYENYPAVFSISADRPPYKYFQIPSDYKYDVFVSLRSYSTGWGTWFKKWNIIKWDIDNLDNFLENPEKIAAFNRGGEDLTNLLILQSEKKIDSWAIRFTYNHFIHHAISILPCYSYIDNIGFDGTGTHSGSNEINFRKDIRMAKKNPKFLKTLYEDKRIINAFYSYYYPKKRALWKKAINRISRILGEKNIFTIKKKVYA